MIMCFPAILFFSFGRLGGMVAAYTQGLTAGTNHLDDTVVRMLLDDPD
jgi:hypothetical protein